MSLKHMMLSQDDSLTGFLTWCSIPPDGIGGNMKKLLFENYWTSAVTSIVLGLTLENIAHRTRNAAF